MPGLPARNCGCLGLILIYTGDGKGKTSACIGQALRALGHGFNVTFAQFIKRPDVAGEQKLLASLLGDGFRAGGIGFYTQEAKKEIHVQAAMELLQWVETRFAEMTVLDEAIYALHYGLIRETDLEPFLNKAAGSRAHLVLSGRHAPAWLCERAHIVTEMRSLKHAYADGAQALAGIEY